MLRHIEVRGLVTKIDAALAEVARVVGAGQPPSAAAVIELQATWSALVGLLALAPEPELRTCPRCSRNVMRDASRCGYCWKKLIAQVGEA